MFKTILQRKGREAILPGSAGSPGVGGDQGQVRKPLKLTEND